METLKEFSVERNFENTPVNPLFEEDYTQMNGGVEYYKFPNTFEYKLC